MIHIMTGIISTDPILLERYACTKLIGSKKRRSRQGIIDNTIPVLKESIPHILNHVQ